MVKRLLFWRRVSIALGCVLSVLPVLSGAMNGRAGAFVWAAATLCWCAVLNLNRRLHRLRVEPRSRQSS
jgi:H+/Cl- antiporter ClcA